MRTHLAIAAAALLASAPAFAQANTAAPTDMPAATNVPAASQTKVDTATFVKTVPGANAFEIESSRLALTKGVGGDLKDFANRMIEDHTKAGQAFAQALDNAMTTSSITPAPAPAPQDDPKLVELSKLSGGAFQARYIAMQADAHKDAVALFSAYANSGDDPALKEFAKATLPTLQMHEKMVKDLQAGEHG